MSGTVGTADESLVHGRIEIVINLSGIEDAEAAAVANVHHLRSTLSELEHYKSHDSFAKFLGNLADGIERSADSFLSGEH
jgi:hypothetical protein